MKKHKKNYKYETFENGVVIIKYKNIEQQFDYMHKLCLKYLKVVHVPEEKHFICSGCKMIGKRFNERETFNEYSSRFED